MMTLFGTKEILKTLDTPYRTWLQKTCPPIEELTDPAIISVCNAFAPKFLPSVATLRNALLARDKEEKCLPFKGSPLHTKTVARLIKLILGIYRGFKTEPLT